MIKAAQLLILIPALVLVGSVYAQELEGQDKPTSIQMLPVPDVDDLVRVSRKKPASRDVKRNSAFVLQTDEHAVSGTRYVVLTDHKDKAYLESLNRLASHYEGIVIQVDDLATLHNDDESFGELRQQLIDE